MYEVAHSSVLDLFSKYTIYYCFVLVCPGALQLDWHTSGEQVH